MSYECSYYLTRRAIKPNVLKGFKELTLNFTLVKISLSLSNQPKMAAERDRWTLTQFQGTFVAVSG